MQPLARQRRSLQCLLLLPLNDSLILAKDRTGHNTCTHKAYWRLMSYISSPTHNIDKALGTIAVALGDVIWAQGHSADPDIITHVRKSRLAVTRALVLGILSIHGHKDRDAFVWALSTLGLHSTKLQYQCFQQYYCLCAGIPDSFCTNGFRRRSPSNER